MNDTSKMLSVIENAAINPDVDTSKMQALLDMQITIMDRNAKQSYAAAMTSCQSEMPLIVKTAENKQTNSKYAKHEMICKQIKPIYTKNGFSLAFSEGEARVEHEIRTVCVVTHELGFSKEFYQDLPVDDAGIKGTTNKTPVHGRSSTFSYARRYLTLMIFDLATYDDNDGNVMPKIESYQTEAWQEAREYYMSCYEHKIAIDGVRDSLADNDLDAAAEYLFSLSNKELSSIRRAPTKGGIFTLEETSKMKGDAWDEARKVGHELNPGVDRSM